MNSETSPWETVSSFKVKPVYMVEGNTQLGDWVLRRFQEQVMDNIVSHKDTLLVAPTGAGKTLSLLLGEEGMVGLYPNNTLLLDQQRSIDRILEKALGARLEHVETSDGIDVLRVYSIKGSLPYSSTTNVAVALLSGRYIGYEKDEEGKLQPKRATLLKRIVEKTCFPDQSGGTPYMITLGTPDTALMLMSGIYRDFEKVGFTLHDLFVASKEKWRIDDILSKYSIATVGEMGDLETIRQCLLKYPWFIDEFHLYGHYESSILLPVLHVYRDYAGWEEPLILSSATPGGVLHNILQGEVELDTINASYKSEGEEATLVRGETSVEVIEVDVPGRGTAKWFRTGYMVPIVTRDKIRVINNTLADGGNVFIVVDRVNQVPPIIDLLTSEGYRVECAVSIKPAGCSESTEHIVVGSESISQGIDRENVKYGIITSYNWGSLIQRFGRIGRKTTSTITLVVPRLRKGIQLKNIDGRSINYNEFTEIVKRTYTNLIPSQRRVTKQIEEILNLRSKLVEYSSIIAFAQVSKPKNLFKVLRGKAREDSRILDRIYGPPETIAQIMMFRTSGPTVYLEKPDGCCERAELGTVLRNYNVKNAYTRKIIENGITKKAVILEIDLEPARMKLVLEPSPMIKEDLLKTWEGTITTLGTLVELGYEPKIKPWEKSSTIQVDLPVDAHDIRQQPIALLAPQREILEYLVYTGAGAEVMVGENPMLALFL